ARAPRLAAPITLRPSPEPRSITKSCGVILAISSIFSTVFSGVGTQTTSLPACPETGANGFVLSCAIAREFKSNTRQSISNRRRAVVFIMVKLTWSLARVTQEREPEDSPNPALSRIITVLRKFVGECPQGRFVEIVLHEEKS